MLRFVIKSAIVGDVVYYSYKEGLWSKPEETAKLYKKLYTNTVPYIKKNIPAEISKELPRLPSVSCVSSFIKQSWNKGIMTTMEFISKLPIHTVNGVSNLYENGRNYMKKLN